MRLWLRTVGEPATRFGEGPYERRERLRVLLASPTLGALFQQRLRDSQVVAGQREDATTKGVPDSDEFFVPGTEELLKWRRWLAEYSVPRSQARIAQERVFRAQPLAAAQERRHAVYRRASALALAASQVGGEQRPLSACALSPDEALVATGDFGGTCRIWSGEDGALLRSLDLHTQRIGNIVFNPDAQSAAAIATCDAAGAIALWALDQPAARHVLSDGVERGHAQRVAQVAFHPSGRLLGSASFDYSWRLWDCQSGRELQLQEGHSRPVYSIAFHPDGALAATGGLDCHGRLWDLRLGRCIWTLSQGHVKAILSIAFHPLLPTIATASEDGTVRLWDMRKLTPLYLLPAHPAPVTAVRWSRGGDEPGILLMTASFDGTAKVWGGVDYRRLATLTGHEGKIMAADMITGDVLLTAGSDQTFKLWRPSSSGQHSETCDSHK